MGKYIWYIFCFGDCRIILFYIVFKYVRRFVYKIFSCVDFRIREIYLIINCFVYVIYFENNCFRNERVRFNVMR